MLVYCVGAGHENTTDHRGERIWQKRNISRRRCICWRLTAGIQLAGLQRRRLSRRIRHGRGAPRTLHQERIDPAYPYLLLPGTRSPGRSRGALVQWYQGQVKLFLPTPALNAWAHANPEFDSRDDNRKTTTTPTTNPDDNPTRRQET